MLLYILHKRAFKVHHPAAAGAFYMYMLIAIPFSAYESVNRFLRFFLGYFKHPVFGAQPVKAAVNSGGINRNALHS